MRDFLIALAVLVVAGAYLIHRARKGGTRDERHRAKAIADANGPLTDLSAADEQFYSGHVAAAEVWRTDAHPVVGLDDPLGASPLDSYWRLPAVAVEDTPLFSQLLAEMAQPVAEPVALESFTQGWTTADIARMVADAKAGASR